MTFIDTHIHVDVEDYVSDFPEVIARAKAAGAEKIFVPAVGLSTLDRIVEICREHPGYLYPMVGLHPEEVKADYTEVLAVMKKRLDTSHPFIAVGEIGLDFYWSREFEKEQLKAFEQQVVWSIEHQLPLMIHCRKAQNEMIHILQPYAKELAGGVFHCFTGNIHEAETFLQFDKFVLGIGGVCTFKNSPLADVVASLPLSRIVLETDGPYMAPVPMRGKRNESAYIPYIIERLAQARGVEPEVIARETTANAKRVFHL